MNANKKKIADWLVKEQGFMKMNEHEYMWGKDLSNGVMVSLRPNYEEIKGYGNDVANAIKVLEVTKKVGSVVGVSEEQIKGLIRGNPEILKEARKAMRKEEIKSI